MAPSWIDTYDEYYTSSFPKDAPTIQLSKISVIKLLEGDEIEAENLFRVCSNEGFFYLDLTTEPRGKKFLSEAQELHDVAKKMFQISMDEKLAFKVPDPTIGHLDTG